MFLVHFSVQVELQLSYSWIAHVIWDIYYKLCIIIILLAVNKEQQDTFLSAAYCWEMVNDPDNLEHSIQDVIMI